MVANCTNNLMVEFMEVRRGCSRKRMSESAASLSEDRHQHTHKKMPETEHNVKHKMKKISTGGTEMKG